MKNLFRLWVFMVFYLCSFSGYGQGGTFLGGTFSAGITLHKSAGFYFENGVSAQYSSESILNNKLLLGLHLVNSRLGTAFQSNAVKQGRIYLSGHYRFLSKKSLNILTGVNTGWFHANYESDLFKDLTNNSMILAADLGLQYTVVEKLTTRTTLGYNLISGNGESGAGTLYPVFYQFTLLWNFSK